MYIYYYTYNVGGERKSRKSSLLVDPIVMTTEDFQLPVTGAEETSSEQCDVEKRFLDLLEGTIPFDSVYNYYHLFFQYLLIICYYSLSNSQIDIIIIILFVYLCN